MNDGHIVADMEGFEENIETERPDIKYEGDSILVIHPGSLHLRVGKASDPFPVTIPHCIAWKCKGKAPSKITPWLQRPETEHPEAIKMVLTAAHEAQDQLAALFRSNGRHRKATSADELSQLNEEFEADESDVWSQINWFDTADSPEFVIGDDALHLKPDSGYRLLWPLCCGVLNIKNEAGHTVANILQSLETLWTAAIESHLNISRLKLKEYKCILLIPDIINRSYISRIMSVLLERIGFAAAFVIQESVCASFGAGLSSVCVVDVGDQKTSICCVEDGISVEQSRVTLNYGGRDITRTFSWLLDHISFPYLDCQPDTSTLDALLLQELKHTYAHMDTDRTGTEEVHFQVRLPGQKITKYSMHIGDERIVSTLSVFWPTMLGLKGKNLVVCTGTRESESSDSMDADYIQQVKARQEETAKQYRKKGSAAQTQQDDMLDDTQKDIDDELIDEEGVVSSQNRTDQSSAGKKSTSQGLLQSDQLLALDQAIIWSIEQCDNDEMKKRMYSCILVVGGGLTFSGTENLLQYRVWLNLPLDRRSSATVVVLTKSKDIDPAFISWKGGAILSLLGGTEEHWITPAEWTKYRCKIVREKAPFCW